MSKRGEHLFQFQANVIAEAAGEEARYHRERERYWRDELKQSIARVKETAKIEVKTFPVTGGERTDFSIDYGDSAAYRRMQESQSKIDTHRQAAERFETDRQVYGTQGDRTYELATDDVHHYRLGGQPRED